MNNYEKAIAAALNKIAEQDIFFCPEKIMQLSDNKIDSIVSVLLSYACQSQGITPITVGRNYLLLFPKEWICEKIKKNVFRAIDINDYWDYRRLLELSEMLSEELLRWEISLGEKSNDIEIMEAVNDYKR